MPPPHMCCMHETYDVFCSQRLLGNAVIVWARLLRTPGVDRHALSLKKRYPG